MTLLLWWEGLDDTVSLVGGATQVSSLNRLSAGVNVADM